MKTTGLVLALSFCLSTALAAQAQQSAAPARPGIYGVVKGDDGTIIPGASVTVQRTSPPPQPKERGILVTTAAADGSFGFPFLLSGQYALCAQAPSGSWLNPCDWGSGPPAVTVSGAQRSVTTTLVMAKGAPVTIRINDPSALQGAAASVAGAHILLGVRNDALIFHPASLTSRDASGTNYTLTIPFGRSLNLVVSSSYFRLAGASGAQLNTAGQATAIPVTATVGQASSNHQPEPHRPQLMPDRRTMSSTTRLSLCLACVLGFPPFASAQCGLGTYSSGLQFSGSADILGSYPNGVAFIPLSGSCPGQPNTANVRFKLSNAACGVPLVVSPSSGVTPVGVGVAVNPGYLGQASPGTAHCLVTFTTVDQSSSVIASVNITFYSDGQPTISGVTDAASLSPQTTPGGAVSITGTYLAPLSTAQIASDGAYPLNLANTTVTFNGIGAPILSTSPSQIYVIAPQGLSGQSTAQVVVTHLTQTTSPEQSSSFTVAVAQQWLSIFPGPPGGTFPSPPGGFGPAAIFNCGNQACSQNSLSDPAAAGSQIAFFANVGNLWQNSEPGAVQNNAPDGAVDLGTGLYTAEPVSLTIGGQPATLRYYGTAPYQPFGIFQVNALIPSGLSPGLQPMVLTIGQLNTGGQQVSVAVK